ncbi:response regulator transcription factor [Bacillus tuaregi]|uniref:response regulator transcription factor n=1 Tax=Bacillus tuaregi TaxID=1816695 RepID=UPI0008F903B4|nr:response regulator [Bacillus tuaregi]
MITVMLVDDEPFEREGLKLMLNRNRSNFEVIAEARNGNQAVELALANEPDLIFMDIKMPGMDGLEAVGKILPMLPNTKVIMVSAFDTFEYAREAMKYGIKEYLLKPSKVSEVLEAFDRMVGEIESEKQTITDRKEINHRLERASSVIEMEFIVSLIMDHVHEFKQEDWDEWIDIEHKNGFVAVFSFTSNRLQPEREEKNHWYRTLKQALQQQPFDCLMGPLTGFQVPVLVLLAEDSVTDDDLRQRFARNMIHQVQHHADFRLSAGVGSVQSDINRFSDSYMEAILALELVHSHPSATYLVYNERLKEKRKELVPLEVEKELIESVKKGDIQKALQLFEAYFQSIQQAADYQVRLLHKGLEDFFVVLNRSINELGYDGELQVVLGKFDTVMQMKESAKAHLLYLTERLSDWRANGIGTLLLQAKEYIDKNYDKSISLEEVAEQIGISSYYLSKLFKEKFQVTFSDYLKNIRMEKAKEFLLDGTMALKEIALNIGYKDPNYFSRAFKKQTGMSPREYRSQFHK